MNPNIVYSFFFNEAMSYVSEKENINYVRLYVLVKTKWLMVVTNSTNGISPARLHHLILTMNKTLFESKRYLNKKAVVNNCSLLARCGYLEIMTESKINLYKLTEKGDKLVSKVNEAVNEMVNTFIDNYDGD